MYFFLHNFPSLDISFTAVSIPRLLCSMFTGNQNTAYCACAHQLFSVILYGATEFFLLTPMSYDRYVAICKPSHCMTIMSSGAYLTEVIDDKKKKNTVTTFVLLGLTDDPELQVLIIIFLFLTYMLSVSHTLFQIPTYNTHILFIFFNKIFY